MDEPRTLIPDDPALIERMVRRDPDALAELFDRYGRVVFGALHRMLPGPAVAAEVCQEVFLHLWRAPDTHREHGVPVHLWLLRISGNAATDWLRANQPDVPATGSLVPAEA